ncbi:MAG: hypothetical protein R2716_13420, partial [Microthrixaceae bacterium]
MVRLLIVVALVVAAVVAAELIRRRRSPDAPTQPPSHYDAPAQLDRGDFEGGDREWLVAVFTS